MAHFSACSRRAWPRRVKRPRDARRATRRWRGPSATRGIGVLPNCCASRGELVLLEGTTDAAARAADHFGQAVDWARRQGALSWELRATTSLAKIWHNQGRSKEARELLNAVYDRFTEGLETADLRTGKALLGSL